MVKFDHFVTTVREKWSAPLLTRSGTGSGQRGRFAAGEEVAVDAPKMDCLGGLLHRWLRALGLALSVLPRTAKLVVLYMISHEKENLRAKVDAADEGDGLQVEAIPFRQDDQPHPAPKRNKHLRLSQPTNHALETITDDYKRFPFVGPSPHPHSSPLYIETTGRLSLAHLQCVRERRTTHVTLLLVTAYLQMGQPSAMQA